MATKLPNPWEIYDMQGNVSVLPNAAKNLIQSKKLS